MPLFSVSERGLGSVHSGNGLNLVGFLTRFPGIETRAAVTSSRPVSMHAANLRCSLAPIAPRNVDPV